MSLIDDIYAYLEDGEWHSTREIADNFQLTVDNVHHVLTFFRKYRVIEWDEKTRHVRSWYDWDDRNETMWREVLQ